MVDRKVKVVILDMGDVSHIDMTAIVAMESLLHRLQKGGVAAVINNLDPSSLSDLSVRSEASGKSRTVF